MNKSLRKKEFVVFILFYIIIGALFIYGTIGLNDLNFDKMVFNPTNKFAFTMASYGMLPRYTMQLLGFSTLMAVYRPLDQAFDVAESLFPFFKYFRENKVIYKILGLLYKVLFLAFIYGSYCGSKDLLDFFGYYDSLLNLGLSTSVVNIIWTPSRLILMLLSYFVLRKLAKNHKKEMEFMAIAGLAMYYSSDVIDMLKEHFHRIRFREMVAYSNGFINTDGSLYNLHNVKFTRDMIENTDFHWFTHWYEVGKDDGVTWYDPRSFPSGHTTAASFSLLLVPLFARTSKYKNLIIPASIVGVLYTVAMGLSRMMRGAHYMTDVTGAALIMCTFMIAFVLILSALQSKSDKKLSQMKEE